MVNLKRIYRLYKEEGLMVRRLKRMRLMRVAPVNRHLTGANQEWALDFVCDAFGRRMLANRGQHRFTVVLVEVIGLGAECATDYLLAEELRAERTNTNEVCDRVGVPAFSEHRNGHDAADRCAKPTEFADGVHASRLSRQWDTDLTYSVYLQLIQPANESGDA